MTVRQIWIAAAFVAVLVVNFICVMERAASSREPFQSEISGTAPAYMPYAVKECRCPGGCDCEGECECVVLPEK